MRSGDKTLGIYIYLLNVTEIPVLVLSMLMLYILTARLVNLLGKVPIYCARGLGSIPGWTNTQDLKIIEEKVLPSAICKWLEFCVLFCLCACVSVM